MVLSRRTYTQMTCPLRSTSVRSQMHRQTTGSQDTPDAVGSLIYVALDPVRQHYRNRFGETPYSIHVELESHLSYHAASMHGIALARRARTWILYGPSEQSRWAPQLGQRSWQACMSIIVCPHMGHSFFLPAVIYHAPGSASYYSCWQARLLRQLLSGLRSFTCSRIRFILLMLAGTAPAAAAIRPIHAPALGSPPVCLDRRRALSP